MIARMQISRARANASSTPMLDLSTPRSPWNARLGLDAQPQCPTLNDLSTRRSTLSYRGCLLRLETIAVSCPPPPPFVYDPTIHPPASGNSRMSPSACFATTPSHRVSPLLSPWSLPCPNRYDLDAPDTSLLQDASQLTPHLNGYSLPTCRTQTRIGASRFALSPPCVPS